MRIIEVTPKRQLIENKQSKLNDKNVYNRYYKIVNDYKNIFFVNSTSSINKNYFIIHHQC